MSTEGGGVGSQNALPDHNWEQECAFVYGVGMWYMGQINTFRLLPLGEGLRAHTHTHTQTHLHATK